MNREESVKKKSRHQRRVTFTLSKKVNSRRTPCFPTDAKDWSLEQENFIFFCGNKEKYIQIQMT